MWVTIPCPLKNTDKELVNFIPGFVGVLIAFATVTGWSLKN